MSVIFQSANTAIFMNNHIGEYEAAINLGKKYPVAAGEVHLSYLNLGNWQEAANHYPANQGLAHYGKLWNGDEVDNLLILAEGGLEIMQQYL